jgi:Fe-S-cluster-containing hydrogenase component 2
VEICPENAISLGPGPTISNGCSNCGLCQNACPTEVFQDELHSDRRLLNQAKALLAGRLRPGEKRTLSVHCQQAESRNNNSLFVPCLGKITENIVLGAATLGFDDVVLTKGVCSHCRLRQGEQLLAESIQASKVLLKSVGLEKFSLRLEEKEKEKEAGLSRRDVFSIFSNKVRHRVTSFLYRKGKAIGHSRNREPLSDRGVRSSPKRELLRELLMQEGWNNTAIGEYRQELPWGKIKIDEGKCSACRTCVALCPTGAISEKVEDEYQSLYFNGSWPGYAWPRALVAGKS